VSWFPGDVATMSFLHIICHQLSRGQWWWEASCCHDMHSMQWVRTLPITMRTVQCCAHVIQCNLTPPDKTGHLQCAGLVESRPFTGNEAVVQSNECWFISCPFQLFIVLCSNFLKAICNLHFEQTTDLIFTAGTTGYREYQWKLAASKVSKLSWSDYS